MANSPSLHSKQNQCSLDAYDPTSHSYSPPARMSNSWTTPCSDNLNEINILLIGPRSNQARKWLEESELFNAQINTADGLNHAKAVLNSACTDICMIDMEDDHELALNVLAHISRYKMACAAILIDDCVASQNDADLFIAGATDICHRDGFDKTTLLHIVRNSHLRSLTSFQYRQEISRITDHLSNIAHELKNPLNALQGFTHLLEKKSIAKTRTISVYR